MALVRVASTTDVPEGEARRFEVDGREVAVANLGGGQFRAIHDVCSHALAYLHEGEVDVDLETIECPKHGSTFDLSTGHPRSLPATQGVAAYRVKVEGDDILIETEDEVSA
ncbi:MAG: non-heme iron oxygenase ferredoxin subunit [Actinobacteria bacterium]|nr:non-heme iron oxygenase ferredoxin subunit [Actinomycetota bacterium]